MLHRLPRRAAGVRFRCTPVERLPKTPGSHDAVDPERTRPPPNIGYPDFRVECPPTIECPAGLPIVPRSRGDQSTPSVSSRRSTEASKASLGLCSTVSYFGRRAPHSYLIRWRMGIAAQLLEHTGLRLAEIAARVGYKSEFAFSRAFARARGLSPARFRNRANPTSSVESKYSA
jgi:AraC-like DNA-binding protein